MARVKKRGSERGQGERGIGTLDGGADENVARINEYNEEDEGHDHVALFVRMAEGGESV